VHTPERGGVIVEMESGSIVRGDALFYAVGIHFRPQSPSVICSCLYLCWYVGRQANTDSLNLNTTRVLANKRGIISVCIAPYFIRITCMHPSIHSFNRYDHPSMSICMSM
jgi:hypothetical protein